MGFWMKVWRPGKTIEATVVGVVLLHAGAGRRTVRGASRRRWRRSSPGRARRSPTALMGYGFIACVLPVWMLLCPRDYLSAFMKIGTILLLALGILIVMPPLQMPALTRFIDGTGPVFAGKLFPFAFITIACGAISGFHALVASRHHAQDARARERRAADRLRRDADGVVRRPSWRCCAAALLDPGVYFAINAPLADARRQRAVGGRRRSAAGASRVTPEQINALAAEVGETTLLVAPAARRAWRSAWRSILERRVRAAA